MVASSRVKMIGPITTLAVFHHSDVTSSRHLGGHHIRSAILYDFISARPFWMTSYPVGHVGWACIRSAILNDARSAILDDDIARDVLLNALACCFPALSQLKIAGILPFNIDLVLEKWRENLGSPLFLLSGWFRGFVIPQTNKMTCANSGDLDQPRHSENGGKI